MSIKFINTMLSLVMSASTAIGPAASSFMTRSAMTAIGATAMGLLSTAAHAQPGSRICGYNKSFAKYNDGTQIITVSQNIIFETYKGNYFGCLEWLNQVGASGARYIEEVCEAHTLGRTANNPEWGGDICNHMKRGVGIWATTTYRTFDFSGRPTGRFGRREQISTERVDTFCLNGNLWSGCVEGEYPSGRVAPAP